MNSLIVFPDELVGSSEAVLTDERAKYAYHFHELRKGVTTKVSVLRGMRGSASVESADLKQVRLTLDLSSPAPPRCPVELIVAVPRPQSVKHLLRHAATLGVEAIHFVRAERTVKSYLSSKALEASQVEFQILKGLEQAYDSVPPDIQVFPSFVELCEKKFPLPASRRGLVADPGGTKLSAHGATQVTLAIGPELGWSKDELEHFERVGFERISLGARIMRVDTAAVFALGQLQLISD